MEPNRVLGIVCFANFSGLGNQTRRLAYMLKPERVMVINSESFSKNHRQNFEWYDQFKGYIVNGFPKNHEIDVFLNGLTDVIVCENPLNFSLFSKARAQGIRTYCQSNYEFCDNLNQELPLPDIFLMPSHWKIDEMKGRFSTEVRYLPPPIDPSEFAVAREKNMARRPERLKLLHVVGTLAASDRNGTLDLLRSLRFTTADFSLTIKSQHDLPREYMIDDRRITYVVRNEADAAALYDDYDALILPRRYGGLALTCNEALMSALPVLMPDISPNNALLPADWLFQSFHTDNLQTRDLIPVYATKPNVIAAKIEWLLDQDINRLKIEAFDLGYKNFSTTMLLPQYKDLWSSR